LERDRLQASLNKCYRYYSHNYVSDSDTSDDSDNDDSDNDDSDSDLRARLYGCYKYDDSDDNDDSDSDDSDKDGSKFQFKCNRPFLYFICDENQKIIFFMGKFEKPDPLVIIQKVAKKKIPKDIPIKPEMKIKPETKINPETKIKTQTRRPTTITPRLSTLNLRGSKN
jgi:hypothetical protein